MCDTVISVNLIVACDHEKTLLNLKMTCIFVESRRIRPPELRSKFRDIQGTLKRFPCKSAISKVFGLELIPINGPVVPSGPVPIPR